jgi:hypothetical protein
MKMRLDVLKTIKVSLYTLFESYLNLERQSLYNGLDIAT